MVRFPHRLPRRSRLALLACGLSLGGLPAAAQEAETTAPEEEPSAPSDAKGESQVDQPAEAPAEEPPGPPAEPSQPGAQDAAPAPEISAPVLTSNPAPPFPDGAEAGGTVVIQLTVELDGGVADPEVVESAGPLLDQAALKAVLDWQFTPASRGGQAVPARIRVAVELLPPPATEPPPVAPAPTELEASAADQDPASAEPHDHSGPHEEDAHLEVTVHGTRAVRVERRAASDFFLHREVLEAAPHAEGADALRAAPGLFLGRSEGLATAHSYTLRGFDSGHGQDIEFSVGGLPINLPSHIHGQGYADLSFLVPEAVDQVQVKEGVRDPKQGDFAVAGTVDIGLGVDEDRRGLQLRSSYGSFDTFNQKLLWAPKGGERESFGAASYTNTAGYGENRGGQSASALLQHRFGEGAVTYRAIGIVHGARADHAGVVRKDDVDDGRVCFHCVYPYPTAQAQNALSQRVIAGFFADYGGAEHASGTLGVYLGYDNYRSQSNFTGFTRTSRTLENVSGRGDLIEQLNQTTTLGLTGRYRTEAFEPTEWAHGTFEVGADGRFDNIGQRQNLLDAGVRNQTWDQLVDASIQGLNLGFWGDMDFQIAEIVSARFGLRAAVLSYAVDDRLGNFTPASRPQDTYLPGFRRSSLGTSVGPRTSLEVKPRPWLSLLASYGLGYRSPQARTLEDGEEAPFAEVHSADLGTRMRFGEPLELSVVGYYTHLSDDAAFDPSEGSLARIGPTQRWGGTVHALSRPWHWMLLSGSVTLVDASLLEPPPATAEEPAPAFTEGQQLPYVPPVVLRIDASAKHRLTDLGKHPLMGELGLGFSYLSARPLPFNQAADPVPLLDARAGLRWGIVDLSVSGFNLADIDYANEEFVFVSDWNPGNVPSRLPARHIAAGAPLTILGSLGVTL